ncbi:ATP-dependent exoDNAse (exonuclease V) beta subunit (contains helicase and exonuclease domains) [Flexibacter flexilis DSM 6793]|uniref:DNA 3'-5' helicase n=1 Tax=Flexibacter flexilis DSM 6793 TaxID=927664 RepID=A0A1I1KFE0_9BACT|nr:UvrD-helicase domain-containing protein [Flexibacter flexilis]SFC59537.1 ATP-dependent exoDNAse (exonuclease V) beta subunit (contains helicase and exonuclease domains) [Flexibacter flexilis DSM 6793]
MSQKFFRIYSSSAGSGKTYTLTREYLQLVMRDPHQFRHILAVTFTNKATEEMKSRIIQTLRGLAQGQSSPLATELQEFTGLSAAGLRERANEVLSLILHNYSQFAISTIDSFFQKILRAFARETDLSTNFRLDLDTQSAINEAIKLLLEDAGKNEMLTLWLTQFAETRIEEGQTWDIQKDILQLANEIFNENFSRFEAALRPHLDDKNFLVKYREQIAKMRRDLETKMRELGQKGVALMQSHGLDVADFAFGKSGVANYFYKIQKPDNYDFGTRVQTIVETPEDLSKWYSKTSKQQESIENVVAGGLLQLLLEATDLYQTQGLSYKTAKEVLRYFYTLGLLANIAVKLQQYRDENDVFLMADVPRFLNGIIAGSDAPYLYEKVGNTYRHFLIDEFQDTSNMQWENFKPLVENSLAEGNLNLIVGDVKQSIYRWRGGDWKLLLEKVEKQIGSYQTERRYLNNNWRSKQNVIAFNNSFFVASANLLAEKLEAEPHLSPDILAEVQKIPTAYADVYQIFPETKRQQSDKGLVRVEFIDKEQDSEQETDDEADNETTTSRVTGWKQIAQKRLVKIAEQLQERGLAASDIAFLVRNSLDGILVAQALLDYKNSAEAQPQRYVYEAVSADSLLLESASSVRLLVSLLAYLHNTANRIASAHVLYEYCSYIKPSLYKTPVPTPEELNELFGGVTYRSAQHSLELFQRFLPAAFIEKRPSFNKMAIYELTEQLIAIFELNKIEAERAYLQGFLDAILEYNRTGNGDMSSFGEWWEKKRQKLSVRLPEGQNAMQIITVHSSKGLEYPAVIIPFCDWDLDHNVKHHNILWASTDTEPFGQLPISPIRYGKELGQTVYAKDYYSEKIQAYLDNLNLLYVAFTRPENTLICLCPKPKGIGKNNEVKVNRVSALLYEAIRTTNIQPTAEKPDYLPLAHYFDEEANVFEVGQWPTQTAHESNNNAFVMQHFRAETWRNRLNLLTQSRGFFEQDESKKLRYQKVSFGLMLHDIMASIRTAKDLKTALAKPYFEGQASEAEVRELRDRVRQALANPQMAAWFSDEWSIYNESDIILPNGKIRRPDRVLIKDQNAVVIDFKTGQSHPKHTEQVQEYMGYLQEMNYKTEGYLVYLPATAQGQELKIQPVLSL